MIILRHPCGNYMFIDSIGNHEIDSIVVNQHGETISRKVIQTDIRTYVQTQVELGYVLETWEGVKNRNDITKSKGISSKIVQSKRCRYY